MSSSSNNLVDSACRGSATKIEDQPSAMAQMRVSGEDIGIAMGDWESMSAHLTSLDTIDYTLQL